MSTWTQLTPSIYHRLAFGSAYGLTDIGLVRTANEDNFLIDQQGGIVAVADGMGGHDGGEIAARLALEALHEALLAGAPPCSTDARFPEVCTDAPASDGDPDATWRDAHMSLVMSLHQAVEHANARVYAANRRAGHGEGGGMGTTLTGFQCPQGGPLALFHVGDSRLYRYRDGELAQLTRDQTVYQQALEAGACDGLPPRNLLLQAIGPAHAVTPDIKVVKPLRGDLYLLCSDGLYGNTPHAAMAHLLAQADAQSLDRCCADLVELAKKHGSRDNITAVLALMEH